jgi:excisionase family DNA binding protein
MNDIPNSRFIRKKQLAAILGVPHRTLDAWVQNGLIPYIAPTRRLYLFDPVEVMKVLTTRYAFTPGQSAKPWQETEPAALCETAGPSDEQTSNGALHSEVRE